MTESMDAREILALLMQAGQQDLAAVVEAELAKYSYVGGRRVRIRPLPELPADAATTVHRVKVTLHGSRPPEWRRLDIPSAMPLDQVHDVLQVAFGWHGLHLHLFETMSGRFGPPDRDEWGESGLDETTATLAQVAGAEKAKVVYIYDFGDDWRHDIVVEQIMPASPGVAYPRCVAGRGHAQPEGSGGIWAANEAARKAGSREAFDSDEVTRALTALATVLVP